MRLIDVDALIETLKRKEIPYNASIDKIIREMTVYESVIVQPQQFSANKQQKALTIKELRLMDGMPVWIDHRLLDDPICALVEFDEESDDLWLTNNLGGRSVYPSDKHLADAGITVYPFDWQ